MFATPDNSATARAALWGGREVAMLALASLVAGLATMPYAAFHFHRVTPYGLLANLAAMPVVSALVMPAGLFGMAAMPFGFDGFFWWLMGWGIDWMITVAQWVAALPGAVGRIAAFGTGPLIAASLGIILLGLLRTPLRWIGAALIVLGVVWALATAQPDILIAADGHTIGVRGKDGRLHVIRTSKDAFLLKGWLAADADGRQATDPTLAEGVSCDKAGCVAQLAGGALVALALRLEALSDDCERAALMVTGGQAPPDCGALVIDQERLRRQGALALRKTRDGFAVDAVRPRGVDRPWLPAVAGDAEDGPNWRARWRHVPSMRRRRRRICRRRIEAAGLITRRDGRSTTGPPGSNAPRRYSSSISSARHFDQRERGVWKLLPDRKIVGGDGDKAECEHVAAGLGDPSDLLPCDLAERHFVARCLDAAIGVEVATPAAAGLWAICGCPPNSSCPGARRSANASSTFRDARP